MRGALSTANFVGALAMACPNSGGGAVTFPNQSARFSWSDTDDSTLDGAAFGCFSLAWSGADFSDSGIKRAAETKSLPDRSLISKGILREDDAWNDLFGHIESWQGRAGSNLLKQTGCLVQTVRNALDYLVSLEGDGVRPPDALSLVDGGGVAVEWYSADDDLEMSVEFRDDDRVNVVWFDADGGSCFADYRWVRDGGLPPG